jgi:hypothetical protein
VISVTDPYGRILGFLDRTCSVNPIDNTHYTPVTTTPSTRTKHFTRRLVRNTSLETHTKYFTSNIYKFSSYLTGSTIHFRYVARNSGHYTTEAVYFFYITYINSGGWGASCCFIING